MKSSLQPGLFVRRNFQVDRECTIGFMGDDVRVYSTPVMVLHIETTCRDLILPHLDAGEDSVGTRVEIDHLGPALEGAQVEIESRIAKVERGSVLFDVVVSHRDETVCRGHHARFVVEVERFKSRLRRN